MPFAELTREVGLDPVLCPHCGRKISTRAALALLFRAIVEELQGGRQVRIPRFGIFKTRIFKARGITKKAGDRIVIGFETSAPIKRFLNRKKKK